MLSSLLSPDWLIFPSGAGPIRPHSVKGIEGGIVEASWGLFEGCVLPDDSEDWVCSPTVVEGGNPAKEIEYNELINVDYGWLSTVGFLLTVGEVILVVALIIVFIGLCSCCPVKARFPLFRGGMYLFLLADLLFLIGLIIFPAELKVVEPEKPLTNVIGWCYGMGWGVVIMVFSGALLLLLDKDPKGKPLPQYDEERP